MSDCTCNNADKHASGECPVHIWGDGPLYEAKVNRIAKERDLCRAALIALQAASVRAANLEIALLAVSTGMGPCWCYPWNPNKEGHVPACVQAKKLIDDKGK